MSTRVVDAQFPQASPWGSQGYALIVKLHAVEGMENALEKLLMSVVEPTRAEPGCVFYQLNRDIVNPGIFHFYEVYKNRDAFLAHLATPYIRTLLIALQPYLARDNEMVFLSPCGAIHV